MSEIRATTISDAAGTGPITLTGQSAAKAWVNFDGTGTVAIRDSVNVASITDLATGYYTINYQNNFNNSDYAGTCASIYTSVSGVTCITTWYGGKTVSAQNIITANTSGVNGDVSEISAEFHGDLA